MSLSLRPDQAVRRPSYKNFLIPVKAPRDLRKKSDSWFRCKKILQKLNYLNFKFEQIERYFFVQFYWFHRFAHVQFEKFHWRQPKGVRGNKVVWQ